MFDLYCDSENRKLFRLLGSKSEGCPTGLWKPNMEGIMVNKTIITHWAIQIATAKTEAIKIATIEIRGLSNQIMQTHMQVVPVIKPTITQWAA